MQPGEQVKRLYALRRYREEAARRPASGGMLGWLSDAAAGVACGWSLAYCFDMLIRFWP